MTPGAFGPIKAGEDAEKVLATGLFERAAKPCDRQRLDPAGAHGDDQPSLLLREDEQRVVLIDGGRAGRTSTGVGAGSTEAQLRAAYGSKLLPTEVTGESAYLKVVDGRMVLQLNLQGGAVRSMYTYDVRDWSNAGSGAPDSPQVYLDGLGGMC